VTTYYLFRHGQTYATKYHLPYFFNPHIGILPGAAPALKRVAAYLQTIPSDLNVTSAFKRCRQSADIVTKITGQPFVVDPRLNEYYLTTFSSFTARLKNFLSETDQKNYQNVVICTHGGIMSGLKHLIMENNFKFTQLPDYPLPGILLIVDRQHCRQIDFTKC